MQMMKRMENESYLAFAKRATEALQDGLIDYQEWGEAVLGENIYSEENTRRCAKFFSQFIQNLENDEIEAIDDKDKIAEIERAKEELIKERKKLQTVNLEAQEYYRALARDELFSDKILEAIGKLKPLEIKKIPVTYPMETTGLLLLADQHYDSNFELKGLFGEVINKYDKDIFKARMEHLLGMMENDRFDYDKLVIVSCGDALEGILRMTSLQKLRGNVIEDAIEFGEYMANWLCAVERRLGVPVVFSIISGNHDVVRSLTQKPEFPEETLAKVIHKVIDLRIKISKLEAGLKEDSIEIMIEPYSDVYYTTIHGNNIMVVHGENNLEDLINYYENYYGVEIDTLYGAHLHKNEYKPVGIGETGDRELIRVPSICGTDTYAKKILKHSRAGAYFALYSDSGKELSKVYYLN